MRRATTLVAAGVAAFVIAPAVAGSATRHPKPGTRIHRVVLPAPDLPSSLAIDENEYTLRPSQTVVAAGLVTVNVYNRGMDDHDVLFYDAKGAAHEVLVPSLHSDKLSATLAPGTYKFVCSLFAGTPESHEALGMHFVLTVK